MASHIDFVEGIYDNIKKPLNYLCDTITGMSNNTQICNTDS